MQWLQDRQAQAGQWSAFSFFPAWKSCVFSFPGPSPVEWKIKSVQMLPVVSMQLIHNSNFPCIHLYIDILEMVCLGWNILLTPKVRLREFWLLLYIRREREFFLSLQDGGWLGSIIKTVENRPPPSPLSSLFPGSHSLCPSDSSILIFPLNEFVNIHGVMSTSVMPPISMFSCILLPECLFPYPTLRMLWQVSSFLWIWHIVWPRFLSDVESW